MGKFQKGNKFGRQFKPGQSGTPSGRPKGVEDVAAAAREFTPEGLEILKTIARNKNVPAAARAMAVNSLLDRAWGKAPQMIDLRREADLKELSDVELAIIAAGGLLDDEPASKGGDDPAAAPGDPDKLN